MSTNTSHIDLNSDVVSFDSENEAQRVNGCEPEPLTECLKGQGQIQGSSVERIVDNDGDSSGANGVEGLSGLDIVGTERNVVPEAVVDGLGKEDLMGGTAFLDVSSVAEAEIVMVDRGVNGQVGDVSLGLAKEDTDASVSMQGGTEPRVEAIKPADTSDRLPNKKSMVGPDISEVVTSQAVSSEVSENQTMKSITVLETNRTGTCVPETGVSQNIGDDSDLFNLVVDLNPYILSYGNVSGDVNVKSPPSKPEFSVSDLVWGKVRSHPWWPGQIFDPLASSEKAKKYFKKDSYLIAYFGDKTFAWNEVSRIKPFRSHFSQMEKQSTMEEFRYAVECALEEVSRRVEFGLVCSCISDEVYAKLKTQIIVNAGITEESSRRHGGDNSLNATSLEPVELLKYIKALAQLPYGGADRLELVIAQAQLAAFYHWKGYSQLPEFNMLGALLEIDEDIPLVKNNEVPDIKNDESVSSGKGRSMSQVSSSHKRKHTSGDSMQHNKKEKSLSDLLAEKGLCTLNGKFESGREAVGKLISQSSGKKRKAVDAISDDSAVRHGRSCLSTGVADAPILTKKTFRVGDSIRRVASQLNGSSPILKYGDGMAQETEVGNKTKREPSSECSSPDDVLSQLCLAARDPMKVYSFLDPLVRFFSELRNYVRLGDPSTEDHDQSLKQVFGGKTGKKSSKAGRKSTKPGITEAFKLESMNDTYWTDRIVQSIPEEQIENQNEARGLRPETASEKGFPTAEPETAQEMSHNLDLNQQSSGENFELEAAGKPVGQLEESCKQGPPPTALILNFTDLDSVPSKANLIQIFSRFGPLHESETEVLKKSNRAKVVFKRHADAESAFSSAGKYSIFGPSLVSYRLKHLHSPTSKASSCATMQGTKDIITSVEGK